MKYMIEYSTRTVGLSHDQNFANTEALLAAFSSWEPEAGLEVLAFVGRMTGNSGYVLVQADDPKTVVSFVSKYTFWNDVDVIPVTDIEELVPVAVESLAWARGATSG